MAALMRSVLGQVREPLSIGVPSSRTELNVAQLSGSMPCFSAKPIVARMASARSSRSSLRQELRIQAHSSWWPGSVSVLFARGAIEIVGKDSAACCHQAEELVSKSSIVTDKLGKASSRSLEGGEALGQMHVRVLLSQPWMQLVV